MLASPVNNVFFTDSPVGGGQCIDSSRKDTNFRFSLDLYSESKLANDVECDLRLVGGYRGGAMPDPTREEEGRRW